MGPVILPTQSTKMMVVEMQDKTTGAYIRAITSLGALKERMPKIGGYSKKGCVVGAGTKIGNE